MDPEKNLMTAVLTTQIQDYINAREITNFSFVEEVGRLDREIIKLIRHLVQAKEKEYHNKAEQIEQKIMFKRCELSIAKAHRRKKIASKGRSAEIYIFENNEESDNYVFGFNFICRYLELDPERFRKKIRELRLENIRELSKGWEKKRI